MRKRQPKQRSSPVLKLLAALVLVAAAVLLLLPALQSSHQRSPLFDSANHLKEVSLALHACNQASKRKHPAAIVRNANDEPLYSWRVVLLPFFRPGEVFDQFAKNEPWDSPHNLELLHKWPSPYLVAADTTLEDSATSIVAVVGNGSIWPATGTLRLDVDFDDASNRILLVALAETGVKWTQPRDFTVDEILAAVKRTSGPGPHLLSDGGWGSPGVLLVAMADGSVRQLGELSAKDIEAMLTRAGGEAVVLP